MDARKSLGFEARAGVMMVMAEQEMDLAGKHDLLARVHALRDQIERAERLETHMLANPDRKEREGERVRGCDRQRRSVALADGARIASSPFQRAHHVDSKRLEMYAGRRKDGPLSAASPSSRPSRA